MVFAHKIPLALYIHTPWCVKKCPYCDFNSHTLLGTLPEAAYISALLTDLRQDLSTLTDDARELHSIFIGGGTPSLFSPDSIAKLLTAINCEIKFSADIEITLEANPGTVEQTRFIGFKQAGVNRLSLGIQSFQPKKLLALGRIHNGEQAIQAVLTAQQAGFNNINLDLMYGLPEQTLAEAIADLQTALALNPSHLSWYQLTLEPNTAFYQQPPNLPHDDLLWDMQQQGQAVLAASGFHPYEISAYTQNSPCRHNLNYWRFGDYLGIGAGAHGKLTDAKTQTIQRRIKTKHPKEYLNPATPFLASEKLVTTAELPLEFMLNALRLYEPIPWSLIIERTGITVEMLLPQLQIAKAKNLLEWDALSIKTTPNGKRYLNDLLQVFL